MPNIMPVIMLGLLALAVLVALPWALLDYLGPWGAAFALVVIFVLWAALWGRESDR